jgi:hypothetical protein
MKLILASFALGTVLLVDSSLAAALPNGTCSGAGMTVTVQGGKIVGYKYGGKSYPVAPLGASKYRIGTAGTLAVHSPKQKSFQGTFSMRNGFNTPATFKCN